MDDSNFRLYINGQELKSVSCNTIELSPDINTGTDSMPLENETFTATIVRCDNAIFYDVVSAYNRECMIITNRIRDRINAKQIKRRSSAESKKKLPNMIHLKQDRRLINVRNRI
jgi:hypothetical protein